jgi:hypothetical protein
MALFFGEKRLSISNHKTQISSTGLIYTRVIDFVKNAVAECEPHPAERAEGCAYACFGAGSPAGRNAWISRSSLNTIHHDGYYISGLA